MSVIHYKTCVFPLFKVSITALPNPEHIESEVLQYKLAVVVSAFKSDGLISSSSFGKKYFPGGQGKQPPSATGNDV